MEKINNKSEAVKWNKPIVQNVMGLGCIYTFFLFFLIIGGFIFWVVTIGPLIQIYQARNWVSTPATIISSDLKQEPGDDDDNFDIKIVYEYDFRNRNFQSVKYNFYTGSYSKFDAKQIINKYPKGLMTSCFVNPSIPKESVLQRGMFWGLMWGLIPFLFFALGLLLPVGLTYQWTKKNKEPDKSSSEYTLNKNLQLMVSRHIPSDSGYRLKEMPSRWFLFIGALIFALFVNGLLATFCIHYYQDFRKGAPIEWPGIILTSLILLPGGLALIGLTFKMFLTLFVPKPLLTVNNVRIPLGKELDLNWEFNKSTRSLKSFHIKLKGVESSTDSQDDNDDEKFIFFEKILFDSDDPQKMERGCTQITIPDRLMHSFESSHHSIEWSIIAEGEVRTFPNFMDEFQILVVPKEESVLSINDYLVFNFQGII